MNALVVTKDISLVNRAIQVSYSIPMCLPFHENNNFTGREPELAVIHEALHSPGAPRPKRRVIVLHGLGGIGKTQLAVQYAYIHQKEYTSVWCVNASTTETLSQGFLKIAQQLLSHHSKPSLAGLKPDSAQVAVALGLPPDIVDQNGELNLSRDRDTMGIVVNAIKSWFAAEDNNQWLLIIDNYDDPGNVNIFDFLHASSSGSILITSRSRDTCEIGEGLEVQEVTEDEALEMLRRSAQRDIASFQKGMYSPPHCMKRFHTRNLNRNPVRAWLRPLVLITLKSEISMGIMTIGACSDLFLVDAEKNAAVAIVRKVGSLPLALDQAGSYVRTSQISFSKYLLRFEDTFAEVAAKNPPTVGGQRRGDTVFTTWEVSFNALGPAAQELLLLFGFLDNESISEELLSLEGLNNGFRIGKPLFPMVSPDY